MVGTLGRLYTGTGAFDVVGHRRIWYSISGLLVVVCLASILLRGFNLGIDFEGGTRVQLPAQGARGVITTQQAERVFT
ncbi:MAG: protein translocase subunit SecF, partial [Pseudonocardiaceae bacterium]